ncbi:2,3-bisphosphoglycerate-dependent phosphoglycerate mutase [Companilactobacillus zhachilii]|jgi:phosphoglycerate mutase, BPG-dependent, family 1|uniref:2,3-bisphosphoglycerate-dependent phosphoglycerate mutase n=1 Tax=Companilactobacillus zhachilii TaxID=2304606 RepID=A0A386PS43_9LACO|nr:2,3-diphosphoglycerate-dependent phosphoglycerate mutase [Companilactobacillus zhachilii]AYE37649.1 2,3-diphosphoglycerate-dependent phosphoglycerate mutase [Companilactobacillus zhachilii]MBL3531228.1 2,3-diphosphoglycerate-dependent phosphoglycerate mutase [Companilactobacillus zhachilii]
MVKLVMVRHGESIANALNQYTGWNNVGLTQEGVVQAHVAAKKLQGFYFDHVHTSVLQRAIITAYIIQDDLNLNYVPITKTWRLNERHYGALRGQNKDATRREFGVAQVHQWRRSFYSVPPELKKPDPNVGPYKYYESSIMPVAESLYEAYQRIIPYYVDHVAPELLDNKNQLIVAHGSTIRALIKYIEGISDQDIDGVEVENGKPLIYEFDEKLNIVSSNRVEK